MVKQCEEKSRRFNCTVNVVILDDELAFAEMLDKQIEIHCIKKDWLYESQIYTSGRELLEKDLSRVQIVFLDIDMPEQSGLDIAKILREHYPELILVFVTAFIEYSTARDVEIRDNRIVLRETGSLEHLTCENVRFTYPEASKPILNGATLSINGQQKVAIVGESGCGKSTLAKLLFQYYPDYTGNILFNGRQVREISRQNFYKHVGYIAQSAYLFNDTIRNNICLLESFSDGQLRHAINSAGLTEWIASLPDGLDTMISENGKNLSGGQRQRIGIARLTLRKYDLIIADEITASLDPETSQQVMDNLLTMSCMVIAITHDVSDTFMQRFDKIYQISSGIITSEQRGV